MLPNAAAPAYYVPVPVVPPTEMPVTILAQAEVPTPGFPSFEPAETAEKAAKDARRKLLIFGSLGIVGGAIVSAGVTALAFRSYRKSGSIVGPAIVSGIGSVLVGGTLLLIYAKFVGDPLGTDRRLLAATMGAQLAT